MPACFQLFLKSDPEAGPVVLQKVDEMICAHFDVPVDPNYWIGNWYGTIGMMLAIGRTFEDCYYDIFKDSNDGFKEMIQFLDDNFTTNCWTERK